MAHTCIFIYKAQQVLPSFLKRKGVVGGRDRGKRRKVTVSWDCDIICLPRTTKKGKLVNVLSYPRKRYRTQLGAWGLIGMLHLTSDMSVDDVAAEVRSVFKGPMHNNPSFPFTFLQPTGGGNKTLTMPSVSSSYQWTAQQVAKLASSRGSVYIMAMDDLYLRDIDSEVVSLSTVYITFMLGVNFRRILERILKQGTYN